MNAATPSVEALRAALGARASALEIEFVAETGSTNADLLERARSGGAMGLQRPRLLVAARQTAGRGRRGRSWQAAPGASLTFSLAWAPARADLSGLSLAAGVAVAEAMDPAHPADRHIAIKWPNDLWLMTPADEGRKLGGILIETTPVEGGRVAVLGLGLNVLEQAVDGASSGVAWLRQLDADATPIGTLERIVPALLDALARFDESGFVSFAASFTARDLLRGRSVRCSSGDDGAADVDGVAVGISPAGELLVRTAAGIEAIGSGEVSVRLADGRAAAAMQSARAPC